jgi:acyl-CoA thioester hydrolase
MGHMNVTWYMSKFDQATWHLFALLGMTPDYFRKQQRGMAAVRQEITYRAELLAGDLVTVRSGVLEIQGRKLRFFHEMWNEASGRISAATILTGVHLDTTIRKACPFPEEILEKAQGMTGNYRPDV